MWKRIALLALVPMLALAQSYTTFPNLQSGNVNFTATIRANGGACSSGQAIVSGSGTVTCTSVVVSAEKGAANGVATLDSGGLVPVSQLPFSGLSYEGSWNANTNSPTLADGVGTGGDFYIANVAGTQDLGSGNITFAVGDWALYNGSVWQKVPSSAAVSSVFGRTGAVTATAGDYTATQVTNTPAGGISATTAQAAINELDTEKQVAASTLTSWAALTRASGFDTFTQTPSSANLRGLLTDETGTGLAYFQGGALSTPASGTLTNATGLPWSTGLTGVPTTAVGYGITGGAKLDAYAGGDTPSAFTLGIVDSVDAAAWRSAIGAGTSSATGTVTSVGSGFGLSGGAITTTGTLAVDQSMVPTWTGIHTFSNGIRSGSDAAVNIGATGTRFGTVFATSLSDGADALVDSTGTTVRIGNGSGWTAIQLTKPTSGDGSGLTSLNGTNISSGTVADARLSSNVPLKNAANTFTAAQTITAGAANQLAIASSGGVGIQLQAIDSVSAGWVGTYSTHPFRIASDNTTRMTFGTAGNVSIATPSSGPTLTTNSNGGVALSIVDTGPSAYMRFGNSADQNFFIGAESGSMVFYVNNTVRATIFSTGGATLSSPTGGDKGAGTLNTAGGIYQNNVAVCLSDGTNCTGSSGVSSITGTSNQVIASASTGAVTLSLPQSIATGSSVQFGSFGVGTAASGVSGEIRATDDITAFYSSDARLKENVVVIPDALEKVGKLRGVTFDWKPQYMESRGGEDGYFIRKHDVGVIAQEVRAVLPEVVGEREDGILAVKYDRLTALLIEAVKDLKAANDELYERVKVLEARR